MRSVSIKADINASLFSVSSSNGQTAGINAQSISSAVQQNPHTTAPAQMENYNSTTNGSVRSANQASAQNVQRSAGNTQLGNFSIHTWFTKFALHSKYQDCMCSRSALSVDLLFWSVLSGSGIYTGWSCRVGLTVWSNAIKQGQHYSSSNHHYKVITFFEISYQQQHSLCLRQNKPINQSAVWWVKEL